MFTLSVKQSVDGAAQHQLGIFAYCSQHSFLTKLFHSLNSILLYMTEVYRMLYQAYTYLDYISATSVFYVIT